MKVVMTCDRFHISNQESRIKAVTQLWFLLSGVMAYRDAILPKEWTVGAEGEGGIVYMMEKPFTLNVIILNKETLPPDADIT